MIKDGKNSGQVLRNNSGQALVIILLIMVVILTVGLALVSRTVTDIKLSGQTELSNRAFNAAEAGVESILGGGATQNNVAVGNGSTASTYSVSSTTVGGSTDAFILNQPIAKDNTQQIWFMAHKSDGSLSDATCTEAGVPLKCFTGHKINFYWGNPGQAANDDINTPALEVSVIYKNGSGYQIAKAAYDPDSTRAANNHFINNGVDTSGNFVPPYNLAFKAAADLTDAAGPFNIGAGTTLYAVRLRLLYNSVPQLLGASPVDPGDTFPIQGKVISSSGSAGNVTRKVQVFESYPYLPGVFDFVLFNGSSRSLSK